MEEILEELKNDGYEVSQFHVNVRSENSEQQARNTKSEQHSGNQLYQGAAQPLKNESVSNDQKSGGLYA